MREIQVQIVNDELQSSRIGPYEMIQVLGRGGMGQVYRARHCATGEEVAIKVLTPEMVEDPEAVARFQREAKVISSIQHPNVARVLDHGFWENGAPYIVMEFINGPSLAELIRNRAELPFSRIARLMTEAALGLQAAYKEKVIHRDIKPANLMLGENDMLKIVDFGLAKNLFENTFKTATGAVLGTPRYMAPEQGRGQTIDHRSDMYSLGASFYHLTAGQPPFEADTSLALMMKHIQAPLTPLYVINPLAPADLSEVIHRLMAKDPGDRYADYDDLIADLRQVELARRAKEEADASRMAIVGEPSQARTIVLGENPQAAAPTGNRSSLSRPPLGAGSLPPVFAEPEPAKSSLAGWLGALAAILILGLAMTALMSREKPDSDGKKRSAFGSLVGALLAVSKEKEAKAAEAERVRNLGLTRDRMNVAYNMCLIFEARKGEFPRRVDDLVEADIARAVDVADAWNHKFVLYPVKRELVSFGEDGVEHSQDDYRLGRDSKFLALPAALQEMDLKKAPD